MFLISLAPPTDADSLRYHLGFPAKALYDGFFYQYEWIHGRLFGYGELLNLFGLFFGTDSFGSLLQVSALTALTYIFLQTAHKEQKPLALLLCITPAFLLFLVSSQKASLLPSL
jgi:hypothetical protein